MKELAIKEINPHLLTIANLLACARAMERLYGRK
jgi:hypothetical protein